MAFQERSLISPCPAWGAGFAAYALLLLCLLGPASAGPSLQGRSMIAGLPGSGAPAPQAPGTHEVFVPTPGQVLPEVGLLVIPDLPPGAGDRPLLVFCHSFGVSHFEVESTAFDEQAQQRGWYLWSPGSRSPVGARDVNYGSVESQQFTRAGIEFVLNTYPIDRKRVYGVGFSMGGAQVTAFAARHLDPRNGMFAALVDHTGSVDQADTWLSQPDARPALQLLFGGTPTQQPFAFRRASVIELDPITRQLVPGGDHQAINLAQTPLQLWHATADPFTHLVDQTQRLKDLMDTLQNPAAELNTVPGSIHDWATLPANDVCNWLQGKQLQIPNQGQLLVDRDDRWLYFDVAGVNPGQFASFDYNMDLGAGNVEITASEGLASISTNLRRWNGGFGQALPLFVRLQATDAGDTVVLKGVVQTPQGVFRNGVPQSSGWSYDPQTDELTITETATGLYVWKFES